MKKKNRVVINNCFGGFHLSDAACARLLELGSTHVRVATPEEQEGSIFGHTHIVEGLPRHDPLLIQVVEELGCKAASGDYAELAMVTIDGNQYSIREYDGAESVYTPSAQYWITIPE